MPKGSTTVAKEQSFEGRSPGALETEKRFSGLTDAMLAERVAKPWCESAGCQGNDTSALPR